MTKVPPTNFSPELVTIMKSALDVTALPFGPDAYCMLLSRRDFLPWLAVAGGVRHESP
jgi:hypothetical protein